MEGYDAAEGQDQVMLLAYFHLCARRCEIFRLRWADDVDFENRHIRLVRARVRTAAWNTTGFR